MNTGDGTLSSAVDIGCDVRRATRVYMHAPVRGARDGRDIGGGAEPTSGGGHGGSGPEVVGGPGEVEGRGTHSGDAAAGDRWASHGLASGARASGSHGPREGAGRGGGEDGVHRTGFAACTCESVGACVLWDDCAAVSSYNKKGRAVKKMNKKCRERGLVRTVRSRCKFFFLFLMT